MSKRKPAAAPPPEAIPAKPRRKPLLATDGWWVSMLNAPALAIITLLVAYPVLSSFWTSLHFYNLRRPADYRFIGMGNYVRVFGDAHFWNTMRVTLVFALLSVALVILLGMAVALILNQEFRGRGAARAMLLVPWAVPGVVNGLMWAGMFNKYGGINSTLGTLHGFLPFVPAEQGWLNNSGTALMAAVAGHVWKEVPFAAIIFLAALQAIPPEQYRAARVDGASNWTRFRAITLPWLLHPILIVAIFETMTAFRAFDLIFTLTSGGPGRATHVIAWTTYTQAFRFLNFGVANAYSYLIALMTMGLTVLYIRLLYRRGSVQA